MFNSVKKVTFQMVDADKAEELVYYWNDKNQIKNNKEI